MSRLTEFDKKIAQVIKFLRQEKRMKQDIPAEALDMKQSNFSHIENGETSITIGQLKIICDEIIEKDIIEVIKMAQNLP